MICYIKNSLINRRSLRCPKIPFKSVSKQVFVVFVRIYVTVELADELRQQLGGHQAASGHQRHDEGGSAVLGDASVSHQTHLCYLRRSLLWYAQT